MLDFARSLLLDMRMSRSFLPWLLVMLALSSPVGAVEPAPALTDREIAERTLTRLETRLDEGLKALRADIDQLRADMDKQNAQLRADMDKQNQQLRADMDKQNQQSRADMNKQYQQLRADINIQFARQFQLTLTLLGVFAALVAGIIGFAVWDRRTMVRPFERTARSLEADLSRTGQRIETVLDAFRALGQRDPAVAAVLKQFNLL